MQNRLMCKPSAASFRVLSGRRSDKFLMTWVISVVFSLAPNALNGLLHKKRRRPLARSLASVDRLLQGRSSGIIISSGGEEAGERESVPEDHKGKFRGKTDGALFRRRNILLPQSPKLVAYFCMILHCVPKFVSKENHTFSRL